MQGEHVGVVAPGSAGQARDQLVEGFEVPDHLGMHVAHAVDAHDGGQLQRQALDLQRVLLQVLRVLQARQALVGQLADRKRRPGQRVDGGGADDGHQGGQARHHQRELGREGLGDGQLHGRCQMRR